MEDKNEYITLTNLKGRGWTDSIIKKMNVLPDKQARNTHSSSAPPTKLYEVVRIEKLEKSGQFIEGKCVNSYPAKQHKRDQHAAAICFYGDVSQPRDNFKSTKKEKFKY